nr:immunoglobulin light chain junction region [Macaca mulatta]MOV82070.1 immunoglobulin light chain junction region [Macaca mulatta]MOV85384.1 immunoglobulin light chain junction region [Macaca mulatta]MOV86117.1 immunoglobulin light chain junction region [Macaca mulatta]
CQQYNSDTRTF